MADRGRGTDLEAAEALVADMRRAWDDHMAREHRFQVRMAEKREAFGPSVEEMLRFAQGVESDA